MERREIAIDVEAVHRPRTASAAALRRAVELSITRLNQPGLRIHPLARAERVESVESPGGVDSEDRAPREVGPSGGRAVEKAVRRLDDARKRLAPVVAARKRMERRDVSRQVRREDRSIVAP